MMTFSYINSLSETVITIVLLALFVGSHFLNLFGNEYAFVYQKMIQLIAASSSILLVVVISEKLTKYNIKWLLYLGAASMAIYVMHAFATAGTKVFLTKIFGIENSFIHLTLGTLLGLAAPSLAYFIIQKYEIPFMFSAPISKVFYSKND